MATVFVNVLGYTKQYPSSLTGKSFGLSISFPIFLQIPTLQNQFLYKFVHDLQKHKPKFQLKHKEK